MHPSSFRLDRIDFKILRYVQMNGRAKNVTIADAVGLSPSPCLLRVNRLEKAGYIKGYGAQIAVDKLGPHLIVFVEVTLREHRKADFKEFLASLEKAPEVIECHHVTSGYDYLLKVFANDVGQYSIFLDSVLGSISNIKTIHNHLVLGTPISRAGAPLDVFEEGVV